MATAENVQAWSTTAATNSSADSSINWAEGQDPATVNNSARGMMAAFAKWLDDTGGGLVAGGTANALTVTTGAVLSSGHVTDGLRLLLKATADNTSATVTFAPDGLTAANIKRADGSALAIGSIKSGMYLDLVYNSAASEWRAANIPPVATLTATGGVTGFIFGLTISNNSTTAIDVAAGSARNSTDVDMLALAAALTNKILGTAWAVGASQGMLDTGVVGNGTYHIHLIKRVDTGVVDVLASLSATAPTLPANYTLFRRIGSIKREGGAIVVFRQVGDVFRRAAATDRSSTAAAASALLAVSVPLGIVVRPIVQVDVAHSDIGDAVTISLGDAAVGSADTVVTIASLGGGDALARSSTVVPPVFFTNTSAQIYFSQVHTAGVPDTSTLKTLGWIDTRGRLA